MDIPHKLRPTCIIIMVNQKGDLVSTYCCMAPDFKNGADASVRLKQEKLSPLLPTDLNITILVHPETGKEEGEGEREREREREKEREKKREREREREREIIQ